ncbi:MAG: PKD domain-containing protein [Bacteroidetes bacterium]|jgi:hypothetical protein|nr:PKD domain-containing protein [Bacteroidota bacterium]HMT35302.1 hypothetical protein [Chitinophagaceae bacterium]MBK6818994.1 PKD domain-containing protein [Bacteroidota bacterium]MBK7041873.1 PKD domain-containing protein [Bacteroidota bacterium]MBK7588725.1 PKD domain-containing protein [Bacteroidota bacterium]
MKYFFILIGLALFLFACDKKGEPFAEICSNKVSYKLTDTIRVDNCSKRYTKQRWLLPDGTISYGDYAYFIPTTSGVFTFKLFVSNDEFVNDFEATKNLTVNP